MTIMSSSLWSINAVAAATYGAVHYRPLQSQPEVCKVISIVLIVPAFDGHKSNVVVNVKVSVDS